MPGVVEMLPPAAVTLAASSARAGLWSRVSTTARTIRGAARTASAPPSPDVALLRLGSPPALEVDANVLLGCEASSADSVGGCGSGPSWLVVHKIAVESPRCTMRYLRSGTRRCAVLTSS